MSLTNAQGASQIVFRLLLGAQLDTIRVYSLIVQLGFVCLGDAGDSPDEIWVSASGTLIVDEESSMVGELGSAADFFARRAAALGKVYQLIGEEVTTANVSESGELQISFGGRRVRAGAEEGTDLEEVWSVVSDSPETTADHRWRVSLDDSGALSAHVPS